VHAGAHAARPEIVDRHEWTIGDVLKGVQAK